MIREAIQTVTGGRDLSQKVMYSVFNEIMSGEASPAQISAFITALRMKGETVDEITAAVKVMREKATKIKAGVSRGARKRSRRVVVDTCGTGGSGKNTFNISTSVAFVVAACGVTVAKHGNRSVSSKCGSADVLERLGVNITITPEAVEKCLARIDIGFLFAPLFHGAMKHAIGPRRDIGIRTIFNIVGPLSNPADASRQVIGVYDGALVVPLAKVLRNLGTQRALVVHGSDDLDEITISGKTAIAELKGGRLRSYSVEPKHFGLKRATLASIRGGSADRNAGIIMGVLSGRKGPARDVVLMNASAALVVAERARSFKDGVKIAAEAIDTGKALEKLERLSYWTNKQ